MTEFIRTESLTKRFGSDVAIDRVDLAVERGQRVAIIGPSAAGKTVLVKCLAGLFRPDAGRIVIDGVDCGTAERADRKALTARIGVLFQRNALFDSMAIWENVAFTYLEGRGMPRRQAKQRAIQLLSHVGLPESVADVFPSDLSGGMQKRVGLARAIANDADILLLDNPTAGLDPILATGIENLIDDIQREREATVVVVTADLESLPARFDRVVLLHEGVVRWAGPAGDFATADDPYVVQMREGSRTGPILIDDGNAQRIPV